ncbi:MAG: hypothetical protein U0324_34855 [Polyangiales bacterium]
MKRAWVLLLAAGCANTVSGTGSAATPTTNLDVTVILWARTPGAPGVGVPAVAEADDGTFAFGATDASGHLRINLDPARRYAVTLVPSGYVPVSLLGVAVPFRTTVRLQPVETGLRPADATVFSRRVDYAGRRAPANRVAVEGGFSHLMNAPSGNDFVVEDWPNAPGLALSAIEFDGAGGLPIRAYRLGNTPRRTSEALSVDFSGPTLPAMTGASVLEFPVVGQVSNTMSVVPRRALVFQRKYTATGDRPATVGAAQLEPPTPGRAARMIVTSFEGELRPERVVATFRVDPLTPRDPTREVAFATRPPFAGLAIALPPVQDLRVENTTAATTQGLAWQYPPRLHADTRGWHRAAFAVFVGDSLRWEGFAVDAAPWVGLPLPSRFPVPLTGAPRVSSSLHACLLRDDPTATEPPWAQAPLIDEAGAASLGRSLLRVCAIGTDRPPSG